MKVSMQLAQSVSNVDLLSMPRDELLKKIGAQLGAVEEVIDWGARYENVVVVKVISCEQHPNADKLHVCLIDDGGVIEHMERNDANLIQVVCGAPNVHADMLAVWIPPGATVPSTYDMDPFVLSAKELRGVISNGMLASPAELGINDSHEGILEIDPKEAGQDVAVPGTLFKHLYGLDDVIIDCENKMFTHRPDCFGIIGVARELAGITHKAYKSPDWYMRQPQFKSASDLSLQVRVETDLVSRFMAVALDNVTVAKSPIWLQVALTKVGIRPINNVVDITNYLMHMTGQPLHAYDYDKLTSVGSRELVARLSKKEERVLLLNGKELQLDDNTIVISSGDRVVGIGGVMGGSQTEVDESTKRIVLEVATFDMYSIRKTAMKYGLFTDAVTRFTKGQSPLQNDRVIAEAMRMVHELCSSTQASNVFDVVAKDVKPQAEVRASLSFINSRLGTSLSKQEAEGLLANVECAENSNSASETRSYLMGVGDIDDKLQRIGVKIVEKTSTGHYKLILPTGTENDYEKLVSWEMKPGYWNEYIGARNVFLFKDRDMKVSRYEVTNDTEHEIVEMCRAFANEYYTSIDDMLKGNSWYVPLLPIRHEVLVDATDIDELRIQPPFWRTDLHVPEDIVEEVGRLYGYDRVPIELPMRRSEPARKNDYLEIAQKLRKTLASLGANELLTYSFVHGNLLLRASQKAEEAFHIRNALSPDLQYYRLSLTPSLLDKAYINYKAGYDEFSLYEIGVAHTKEAIEKDGLPQEKRLLCGLVCRKGLADPFYLARTYVYELCKAFGMKIETVPLADERSVDAISAPYDPKRSAVIKIQGEAAGIVGEYSLSVLKNFKLPHCVAGYEISIDTLMKLVTQHAAKQYKKLSRFPKTQQDITIEVPIKVMHGQMLADILKTTADLHKQHGYVIDVTPGAIFQSEDSDRVRMTFRLVISHPDRTLMTDEVNQLMDEVSRRAVTAFAGTRI